MISVIEQVALIGVPSSAGAFAPGQEKAPKVLRDAGLVEALEQASISVIDQGDSERIRWRPDPENRRSQNSDLVVKTVEETATRVETAISAGEIPLVIGGDCTIGLGTVAGTIRSGGRVGLLYFDLHPDLNTPQSTDAGALDWMGIAHAIGEEHTLETLNQVGPRFPLLKHEDVFFFSFGPDNRTEWERDVMERHDLAGIPVDEVADAPEETAKEALRTFGSQVDQLVIHFDVDTIDFVDLPLSENGGRNEGLTFEQAMRALRVLLESQATSAITITELNPDHGSEDGSTITTFIEGITNAFKTN